MADSATIRVRLPDLLVFKLREMAEVGRSSRQSRFTDETNSVWDSACTLWDFPFDWSPVLREYIGTNGLRVTAIVAHLGPLQHRLKSRRSALKSPQLPITLMLPVGNAVPPLMWGGGEETRQRSSAVYLSSVS